MVAVRKRRAGSDSLGHVWVHDDDTVEMPYDQAMQLIAIRDAGFEIVEPDETSDPPPVRRGRKPSSEKTEITETAS